MGEAGTQRQVGHKPRSVPRAQMDYFEDGEGTDFWHIVFNTRLEMPC